MSIQNAWHLETTVQPGGRIELTDPALTSGMAVEIFVLPKPPVSSRQSAVEILAQAPGHRQFKTAEEVDQHLRDERDAWD